MAIIVNFENRSKRRITVNDLENGDIFIYDGTPYMLLSNGGKYGYFYVDKDDNNYGKDVCEHFAVDFSQGILRDFDGSETVGLIEKELAIQVDLEDISEWM